MKILLKIAIAVTLALGASVSAVAQKASGILIYTDSGLTSEQYAHVMEYVSAETFPTVVNLVTIGGGKLSVVNTLVYRRIDYGGMRPEAFPAVLREEDLAPIDVTIKGLDGVIGRYPKSRRFLDPLIADLKMERERFRQGQGKWNGRWYATLKLAIEERNRPLRLAAAERLRQAELEKAQADQMEIAAKRAAAEREAAVADEKANARTFQNSVSALFGKFLDDPSWKKRAEDLSKNTPISPELKIQVERLTDNGRDLLGQLKIQEAQFVCEKSLSLLKVVAVWAVAAESFSSGETANGAAILKEFLSNNSATGNPELTPVWDSLLTFFKACRMRQEAAKSHLQKARDLSARGKNVQAIKEYETAHSLFPDREIAPAIEKLRKESLGL